MDNKPPKKLVQLNEALDAAVRAREPLLVERSELEADAEELKWRLQPTMKKSEARRAYDKARASYLIAALKKTNAALEDAERDVRWNKRLLDKYVKDQVARLGGLKSDGTPDRRLKSSDGEWPANGGFPKTDPNEAQELIESLWAPYLKDLE